MNNNKLLILFFLLMLNNCKFDNQILDTGKYTEIYFPLEVGNVWYYDIPNSENNPYMKRIVEGIFNKGNQRYNIVKDTYGYSGQYPVNYSVSETLRIDYQGRVWKYINEKDNLLFDFSSKDGETYKYPGYTQNPEDEYIVTVKKIELVEVNETEYKNCIEFLFDKPMTVDDEKIFLFAKGIGLIKETAGERPTIILSSYEF